MHQRADNGRQQERAYNAEPYRAPPVEGQYYRTHQQNRRKGKKAVADKAFYKPDKKPNKRAVGIEVAYKGEYRKDKANGRHYLPAARRLRGSPFRP